MSVAFSFLLVLDGKTEAAGPRAARPGASQTTSWAPEPQTSECKASLTDAGEEGGSGVVYWCLNLFQNLP